MVVANNVRCAWKSRTGLKEIVRYTNTVNRNRRARTAMNFALPDMPFLAEGWLPGTGSRELAKSATYSDKPR